MKPKQADILRHASTLFNREGYQSPSIERIAEHAGISKMTFYRYYADKEALILAILRQKESEFMQDLAQITADKPSAREKLFAVFDYYHRWFTCALFEYGASSPAIREQCSRFKSLLWQFFRDILLQVLKPEPAERVAMMMVMLIDGAIAAQQAESAECREIPPGVTAWSAAKALIYSEGGTL
ncbi:TPA: TetR/AcrR family transcriptional regulator [Klebsiella pneumoniae]|nr:TetR/AcrR family transcriptional regulator [Klebsiella pneumoniae]